MGYSPWGHKKLDTTEHPNSINQSLSQKTGREGQRKLWKRGIPGQRALHQVQGKVFWEAVNRGIRQISVCGHG